MRKQQAEGGDEQILGTTLYEQKPFFEVFEACMEVLIGLGRRGR